ncbi:hypothetical protein NHX12_029652 [Muraenolepis orangiensis]|uniref:Protein kinase domain-containing protein n=1 Tax=Muraenolepis orangiensis TaxID=630683 RepID=A0A9Q0E759_9TELE|nr:hypothetical protein NHX12_029652 [Muraenolepis orangiensis]
MCRVVKALQRHKANTASHTGSQIETSVVHATGREVFDWILDQGYYSERDTSNVVRQVLEAVAYLHSLKIVHRNLKLRKWLGDREGDFDNRDKSLFLKILISGNAASDKNIKDGVCAQIEKNFAKAKWKKAVRVTTLMKRLRAPEQGDSAASSPTTGAAAGSLTSNSSPAPPISTPGTASTSMDASTKE